VSTLVLRLKAAEFFLATSWCTYSAEKSGLRDVKRAVFFRYWRISRLKCLDKPKIFIKKNVRNHLHHQFYSVLVKIWINRIPRFTVQMTLSWGRLHPKWCLVFGSHPFLHSSYGLVYLDIVAATWSDVKYQSFRVSPVYVCVLC